MRQWIEKELVGKENYEMFSDGRNRERRENISPPDAERVCCQMKVNDDAIQQVCDEYLGEYIPDLQPCATVLQDPCSIQ